MSVLNYQVRLNECEELVVAMTGTLGLTDRLAGLPEAERTLDEAIFRCLSCKQTEACIDWLATHAHAGEAPEYCRNTDLFSDLNQSADKLLR